MPGKAITHKEVKKAHDKQIKKHRRHAPLSWGGRD